MKTNKALFYFILSLQLFSSCKQKKILTDWSEKDINIYSDKLNTWFEEKFQEDVSNSPMTQTYLGIKTDYDQWDDISQKAQDKELLIVKNRLSYLKDSIDPKRLNKSTALSYELMILQLNKAIRNDTYRFHKYPINQMFGYQSTIPSFLINMHQISNKKDAEIISLA